MNILHKFQFSDTNKRYHTYDYYMKKRFNSKCVKIPIDCGFTCPNIDGTKGYGGCTYCSGNFTNSADTDDTDDTDKTEKTIKYKWRKWNNVKYTAYFQAFTNTYAPLDTLKHLYEEALTMPDVIGLNIATRADSIADDVLDYLRELSERTFLTVELGLQTVHDITAEKINRCHSYAEFLDGYNKLRGLNVCVHIINGLPGENKSMMLETAKELARLHPAGIKIHLLHILKNTVIANQYENGEFNTLTLDEYINITVSQLELLPEDIYIGRITGDGLKSELIAPLWSLNKFSVMNGIDKFMANNDTYQGRLYK